MDAIGQLAYAYSSNELFVQADVPEAIREVKDYISAHLDVKISLIELSEIAGMDKFKFLRWFKKNTGLTPVNYIILNRIERGKEMIRQGKPLIHIALDSGFYDQSHFTNYFKYFVGITPREYQHLMINAYPDAFGGMSDYYVVNPRRILTDDQVMFITSTPNTPSPSGKAIISGTSELIWDVQQGKLGFGDAFSLLHHEFDHVQRNYGLNGKEQLWGNSNHAEREFLAYYSMANYANPTWPRGQGDSQSLWYENSLLYYNQMPFYRYNSEYEAMAFQMNLFLAFHPYHN